MDKNHVNLHILGISLLILASCSHMDTDEPRGDQDPTFFLENMNGEVGSNGVAPGVGPEETEENPDLEIKF